MRRWVSSLSIVAAGIAAPAFVLGSTTDPQTAAHTHHHEAAAEAPFGKPGDPKQATRTIVVDMTDDFRFAPAKIAAKRGETVRIVARNRGNLAHELVIGTRQTLEQHAAMMRNAPAMHHDDARASQVAPGESRTIVWKFTRAGEFQFACLIAGHYEAGMIGNISVR